MDFSLGIGPILKSIGRRIWNLWLSAVDRDLNHDVAIFKKLDAIANESHVDDILNNRIYTSYLRPEDDQVLVDLYKALNRTENLYLDSKVQLRAGQLAWEMGELLSFVGKTFWPVSGGWRAFRPDPIDPEVYDTEWEELNQKLESTWESYETYRMAVKTRLRL